MRTDLEPFRDARVRRAVALVINRPQQIQRVMLGEAQLGNDSPFWQGFASSDRTTQQRTQNLAAGESSAQGGRGRGPEVHAHDVELPRPHGPRRVDPGVCAAGGHRGGARGHGRLEVLRLGAAGSGLRDHHALAEQADDAHGVRRARRAEHLHHALLHVDGRLERFALQEPGVRPAREQVPRGGGGRVLSATASKAMAGSSSTTRRSSPTTSSSTSRRAPRR